MYCVIQFYVQLRQDLADHHPFLKVLAIKLVIFLSFWQSFMISILTSATFNVVKPTTTVAYPDLKVGIPSLLLCIEMAIFAVLHLFAFPWKPYSQGHATNYPMSPGVKNELGPKQGGPLGLMAIVDAMNPWDLVKGFARGMRWLFVGLRHREKDSSYNNNGSLDFNNPNNDMSLEPQTSPPQGYKRSENLPIAEEFRRSKFGLQGFGTAKVDDEGAGLIAHAQPNPLNTPSGYVPARQRYDANGQDISSGGRAYNDPYNSDSNPDSFVGINPTPGTVRRQENKLESEDIGMAVSDTPEPYQSHVIQQPYTSTTASDAYLENKRQARQGQGAPKPSEQWANPSQSTGPQAGQVHNALWGQPDPRERSQDRNQF